MPSMYAHHKMGLQVKALLGKPERQIIEKYPQLFLIGLHGPDILFYYKPLSSNPVNRTGYGMHDKPGSYFFARAAKVIKSRPDKEACLSYVYGFICHFALDVTCHGYIDEKIKKSGVSHTEIEAEFDRELMTRDGLNPIRQKLAGHIAATPENAAVIQAFFPKITARQTLKALKGTIFYNNLLVAPSPLKRGLIYAVLKLSGNYEKIHGLVLPYKRNEKCADSTRRLTILYDEAKKLAVKLIGEYGDFLSGERKLSPVYEKTFDSKLPMPKEKTGEKISAHDQRRAQ
ncbi:MAG TPA: zinc dependent phospholipase C family protein [Candidatus Acetatifactor stercoripullorum]|uniref:Zinc dependent phospholipase C family protein n=1 Tax=Candidatus Acetatifactor stercoripullorum TaxID=2838414 RepID=A0A9D1R3M5_9FIRM|nr:zinc dependent phospholipase C family protein [Candidatus Acetatifactor stercoripullorum]HIW80319.1 zinc dependent phospholipase C family protein [Candidatus Acetatifactor stercoripullorum]